MPETEATSWCRAWQVETDISHFERWNPRIEAESEENRGHLSDAIERLWDEIKRIRPPCLSHCGGGRPSIWLTSIPVADPTMNLNPAESDRAAVVEYHFSIHNPPDLPSVISFTGPSNPLHVIGYDPTKWKMQLTAEQLQSRIENHFVRYVASQIDFNVDGAQFCGGGWISETRKREERKRCPVCGDFGDGEGKIGNQRRFFHERNRSCYIGVVEPKQKHNPTVKCAKCGESGTEHHGKDGHIRVRHRDRICYVG